MFFLLGIMLDWRLTLYLKVEPLALFNLHHYISTIHLIGFDIDVSISNAQVRASISGLWL